MPGILKYTHYRTSTANRRPLPANLLTGEVALNINNTQPGLFFKTATGQLVKAGPVHVGSSPPSLEASGHQTLTNGELWYDTVVSVLKVYNTTLGDWVQCFQGVTSFFGELPPDNPSIGSYWFKESTAEIFIYVGLPTNAWINIAPTGGSNAGAIMEDLEPTAKFDGTLWFETDTNILRLWNEDINDWVIISGGGAFSNVIDTAYGPTWDNSTNVAPSQNAVYDKLQTITNGENASLVDNTAYGAGWNGSSTRAPSKDAVYDKIETLTGGATGPLVNTSVYGPSWSSITNQAPSQSTVYTKIESIVNNSSYGTTWNSITTQAPSMAATYASIEEHKPFGRTMNGRLSLHATDPVAGGILSSTTINYIPYIGNTIYLYDVSNTRWVRTSLSTVSLSASGWSSDVPRDIFIFNNAGTLTLEAVAWTNRTTRATELALQHGVPVKASEPNKRYIGSASLNNSNVWQSLVVQIAANTACHNTLYNEYNQVVGQIRNTFTATLSVGGTWSLFNTNSSHRILVGSVRNSIPVSMNVGIVLGNSSAATRSTYVSAYEGFSASVLSSQGGGGHEIGADKHRQTFFTGMNASPCLFSYEARYYVDVITSVTAASSGYSLTFPT